MQKIIEESTLLNQKDQSFLLRHFARLPIERQLEILNRHRKILFMRKKQNSDEAVPINIVSYMALILAIKSHFADEKKLNTKHFDDMDLDEIRALSTMNLERFKAKKIRKMTKRAKVLGLWAVIKTLRDSNVSFRDISRYLKQHHSLEVGHSMVHTLWTELENNTNKE